MYNGKEVDPRTSIIHARFVMESCGIQVTERWFDSGVESVYSVRLEIQGTNYGSNGKGVSKEYALASAYGELIERLGNGAIFKHGERKLTNTEYTYFPDEFVQNLNDLNKFEDNPILIQALQYLDKDFLTAYRKWKSLIETENAICLNYCSQINNKTQIVPVKLLKIYGSNGMSAGNNFDEAFVQAVSEIFERYSLNTILTTNICPPSIPKDYIQHRYPEIYSIIQSIESDRNLTVEIKDCSLGLDFPVICACIFNKALHTDAISFGSHPIMKIAMERALTEAFQGRNKSNITNYVYKRKRDTRYNRYSILKNAIGYYPYSLYSSNPTYPFTPAEEKIFTDNAEIKNYIINLCRDRNIEIYTHTANLYGFSVIHVIMPGLSEIIKYDNFQFEADKMHMLLSKTRYLNSLNKNLHLACLEFIDYSRKNPQSWFDLSKDILSTEDYSEQDAYLLKFLLCSFYQLKDYEKANTYNELLKQYMNVDYYSCIVIILDMLSKGFNKNTIILFLRYYYYPDTIDEVFSFLEFTTANPLYCNPKECKCSDAWLRSVVKLKEGITL